MVKLFAGARAEKGYVIKSILLALAFWAVMFYYQFITLNPGEDALRAVIRSSAFTGAIFIGVALMIGPVQKLWPSRNYIKHRRTFGVLGFTFILNHVGAVFMSVNFNPSLLYPSLNPYVNPIVFGTLAFMIYVPMYLTSTDWATSKLGYNKWKFIHRFVYIAYILSVLHYTQINPFILSTPPGILLLAVTALVFILELAAFVKHAKTKGGTGKYIGLLIIIFGAVLFYLAYAINKVDIVMYGAAVIVAGLLVLLILNKVRKKTQMQNQETN